MLFNDELEDYKLYCATNHTNDPGELTRRLFN